LQASGNCGALAWHVANMLAVTRSSLVEWITAILRDIPIEKTIYYGSFVAMCAGSDALAKQCFETRTNPYFKNQYNLDLVWNLYHNVLSASSNRLSDNDYCECDWWRLAS